MNGSSTSIVHFTANETVLGFTSPIADNISANVVGLVIGTAFRFLMYRFWVYGPHRSDGLTARRNREAAEAALVVDTVEN